MKRVDLEVAAAAGLAAVFPLYQIFIVPELCDSSRLTPVEAVALLAALASYLSAPSLSGLLRGRRPARFAWLRTPVLGSLLSAIALYGLVGRALGWGLWPSAKLWLALSLWTLPFAAAAYYSGTIVRRIRRWHKGPQDERSISNSFRT